MGLGRRVGLGGFATARGKRLSATP